MWWGTNPRVGEGIGLDGYVYEGVCLRFVCFPSVCIWTRPSLSASQSVIQMYPRRGKSSSPSHISPETLIRHGQTHGKTERHNDGLVKEADSTSGKFL